MTTIKLKEDFLNFCKLNKFEKNEKQISIVTYLESFLQNKKKPLFPLKIKRKNLVFIFMEKLESEKL